MCLKMTLVRGANCLHNILSQIIKSIVRFSFKSVNDKFRQLCLMRPLSYGWQTLIPPFQSCIRKRHAAAYSYSLASDSGHLLQ